MSLPISLPQGFTPTVQEGEVVTKGQVIAESNEEEVVNIPEQLGIHLEKVKDVLKKNPGDPVKVGEDIAVKKGFWGGESAVVSKVDGVVARYERTTGNLVIKIAASSEESVENDQSIISPVDGVVSLCDNEKIVIQTEVASNAIGEEDIEATSDVADQNIAVKSDAKNIFGIKGVGGSVEGEIFILEESFAEDEEEDLIYALDRKTVDKVVVGDKFTKEIFVKGVSIGVAGFVGSSISEEDFDYLITKKIPIPVVKVEAESIKTLRKWEGKQARVEGEEKRISLV